MLDDTLSLSVTIAFGFIARSSFWGNPKINIHLWNWIDTNACHHELHAIMNHMCMNLMTINWMKEKISLFNQKEYIFIGFECVKS